MSASALAVGRVDLRPAAPCVARSRSSSRRRRCRVRDERLPRLVGLVVERRRTWATSAGSFARATPCGSARVTGGRGTRAPGRRPCAWPSRSLTARLSLRAVAGPNTPSAVSPCSAWNAFSAASAFGPKPPPRAVQVRQRASSRERYVGQPPRDLLDQRPGVTDGARRAAPARRHRRRRAGEDRLPLAGLRQQVVAVGHGGVAAAVVAARAVRLAVLLDEARPDGRSRSAC